MVVLKTIKATEIFKHNIKIILVGEKTQKIAKYSNKIQKVLNTCIRMLIAI